MAVLVQIDQAADPGVVEAAILAAAVAAVWMTSWRFTQWL